MASGVPSANGSATRAATTASSASSPRRRRARDLPYLRPLSDAAFRALLPRNPRPEFPRLLPESIRTGVVFYHDIGEAGLLLLRQLPRLDGLQRVPVHAPLRSPGPLAFPGHGHGHGVVEIVAPSGLEQQRYLDREHVAAAEAHEPVSLVVHQG